MTTSKTARTRSGATQGVVAAFGVTLVVAALLSGAAAAGLAATAAVGLVAGGAASVLLPARLRVAGVMVLLIVGGLVVTTWDADLALAWLGGLLLGIVLVDVVPGRQGRQS